MNETKYGVISDVHQDPRIVKVAIDKLKAQGVEKLLVNGDIGIHADTLQDSQQYTAFILDTIGKSGLESFVQPGSHETICSYEPVIDFFTDKYSNIIDTLKNPKVEFDSHHLAFLPGSDWNAGGEYHLVNDLPTGLWLGINETPHRISLNSLKEANGYLNLLKEGDRWELFRYNNMNDLRTIVNQPDKTIVVCHVPRKFDNVDTSVDMAEFGDVYDDFNIFDVVYSNNTPGQLAVSSDISGVELQKYLKNKSVSKITGHHPVESGAIFPSYAAMPYIEQGLPVKLKKENRGNEDLKNLYEELGITKAVSGHFHESSHRATDSKGIIVPQNKFVDDLYWNAGHLDVGHTGILIVKDGKVNYQNINL